MQQAVKAQQVHVKIKTKGLSNSLLYLLCTCSWIGHVTLSTLYVNIFKIQFLSNYFYTVYHQSKMQVLEYIYKVQIQPAI